MKTHAVSVVELRVPSSGTPTQRVPNRWLYLQILDQGSPSLNSMDGNSITDAFNCNSFQASNKWLGEWEDSYVQITSLYVLTFENSQ